MDTNQLKKLVAERAVEQLIKDGMKVGIGTGSTALKAAEFIGKELQSGKIKNLLIVPGSFETRLELQKYGITLYSLNDPVINGELDITIDGADEVDPNGNLIKGGGGGLLLEKIIGYASREYCIVVDHSKLVTQLGKTRPLPIEIIPEAYLSIKRILDNLIGQSQIRMAKMKAGPVITERGNIILDVTIEREGALSDLPDLEREINAIPGVVENGLFTRRVNHLYIARTEGIIEKQSW